MIKIVSLDSNEFSTVQGYLKNIFSNFFSLDEKKILFVINFLENDEKFCEDIIHNLNGSNCEILIEIFKLKNSKVSKFKNILISVLLNYFFLGLSDNFDNIINLVKKFFKILSENFINLELTIDYVKIRKNHKNLFGKKLEQIFYFKLIFLSYLASVEKITKFHNPVKFLNSYKIFGNCKKRSIYLIEILDCYSYLITKNYFLKNVDKLFLENIFKILEENPFKDIIHIKIFYLLEKLEKKINKEEELNKTCLEFILKIKKNLDSVSKNQKEISLNFYYNITKYFSPIEKITTKKKEEYEKIKIKLNKIYNFFPLDDNKSIITNISIKSSVKEVLFDSGIDYFGIKTKIIDEKKFHYEDEILNEDYLSSKSIDLDHSHKSVNNSFIRNIDFVKNNILRKNSFEKKIKKKDKKKTSHFLLGDFKSDFVNKKKVNKYQKNNSTIFFIAESKNLDDSFELISKSQNMNDNLEDSFVEITNY